MRLPFTGAAAVAEPQVADDLAALRRGDSNALTEILRRHEKATIGYLINLTGDPTLAQDLSQETFLRLIRRPPRHQKEGSLRPWLIRVARNLFHDHLRKNRRLVSLESQTDSGFSPSTEAKRPDSAARDLLATLPTDLKEIVQLRIFGELTFREIAETLSIPLGTAQWRMNCALEKLRSQLGENDQ